MAKPFQNVVGHQFEDVLDDNCVNFLVPDHNLDENLANFMSAYNNQKTNVVYQQQSAQQRSEPNGPPPSLTARRGRFYGDIFVEPTTSASESLSMGDLDVSDTNQERKEDRGRGARFKKYYPQFNTNIPGMIRTELGTEHRLSNLEDPEANTRPVKDKPEDDEIDHDKWMKSQMEQFEDQSDQNKYQGWVPKFSIDEMRNDLPLYIGNSENDRANLRSTRDTYPNLNGSQTGNLAQLTSRMTLTEKDFSNQKVNTREDIAANETGTKDKASGLSGQGKKGRRVKYRPLE